MSVPFRAHSVRSRRAGKHLRHGQAGPARPITRGMSENEIDATGLLCPLPVLRLRKRLLGLRPGDIATLRATDPVAVIDVPHFCTQSGHELLESRRDGDVQVFRIRRGPDRPEDA